MSAALDCARPPTPKGSRSRCWCTTREVSPRHLAVCWRGNFPSWPGEMEARGGILSERKAKGWRQDKIAYVLPVAGRRKLLSSAAKHGMCKAVEQHNRHAVQYLLNISVERSTKLVFLALLYHRRSCWLRGDVDHGSSGWLLPT